MPGTTSKETPAARSAAISSPARPKISGSPDLRRTTRLPSFASRTRSVLISPWVTAWPPLRLADIDAAGVAAPLGDDRLGHQAVIDDDVGFLEGALGAERQQILGARTGADQRHMAGEVRPDLEHPERFALGVLDAAGKDLLGDRPGEEARPEAAALGDRAERPRHALAQPLGKPGEVAEGRGKQRLDPGADVARKHRRHALAADGDRKRRPVDDGGRVEVAKLRPVDDVDRHAGFLGERHGFPGRSPRAGRCKDQRRAGEIGGRRPRPAPVGMGGDRASAPVSRSRAAA